MLKIRKLYLVEKAYKHLYLSSHNLVSVVVMPILPSIPYIPFPCFFFLFLCPDRLQIVFFVSLIIFLSLSRNSNIVLTSLSSLNPCVSKDRKTCYSDESAKLQHNVPVIKACWKDDAPCQALENQHHTLPHIFRIGLSRAYAGEPIAPVSLCMACLRDLTIKTMDTLFTTYLVAAQVM